MPLLLHHFREICGDDEAGLDKALAGLARYQAAARAAPVTLDLPVAAWIGPTRLLHIGGAVDNNQAPIVLVPSIINGPQILHLAPDYSLAAFLAEAGYATYLLDWGAGDAARVDEGLERQVAEMLNPLLATLKRNAHIIGYCLGGLHAMAAAQLSAARSLTMIASPWDFAQYGAEQRAAMQAHWAAQMSHSQSLQCAPIEVLQAAFWHLDPAQLVGKFAKAADLPPEKFAHFVRVEDWANSGEALPLCAARDVVDGLFARNETGNGEWRIAGEVIGPRRLRCPALSVRSRSDRIVPFAASPVLPHTLDLDDGHVGMMIGSRRKAGLWAGVLDFIRRADARQF